MGSTVTFSWDSRSWTADDDLELEAHASVQTMDRLGYLVDGDMRVKWKLGVGRLRRRESGRRVIKDYEYHENGLGEHSHHL